MSTNPLNDISKVYLEQIATEAFVDPEQGEAPSGRSPLQNVSDHPSPLVRKKAVKAFKKQMGKEYGGTWQSRSKDPVAESTVGDRARSVVADDRLSSEQEKTSASMDKLRAQTKRHEKSTALARTQARIAAKKSEDTARAMHPKPGVGGYRMEEAKPDYLDFDDDGNKKESMKKALRDKAKKKNLDEAGGRHGGGSMVGQPGGPPARNQKPQGDTPSKSVNNVSRTEARFGKKPVQEAKKPNDGDLANNYPPYDKVTRGDVIAGRLGKDQMGGKKKTVKEGFSNWREDLREVMSSVEKKDNDVKITEKKVENKIKTSAMGGGITLPEAIENLGGTLLEMEEIDEKITAKTDMGAAIKDFYTSKSPQLAGRTKEERRKAAIAAVLTARRGGRKRVAEQAMELQPKTQQKVTSSTSSDNIKAIAAAQKAKQAAIALKTKELATLRQTPAGTAVSTFG